MNIKDIRKDFPIVDEIAYLDNACMTLKPFSVIEAVNEYYHEYPVCGGGRSPNSLSKKLDEKIRQGRKGITDLINADSEEQIVFTKNTTEAINMVAQGMDFEKGDIVLTTDKEHNSNLSPWLKLKRQKGTELEHVFSKEDHTFDLERFKEKMNSEVKLVSMVHTSNLDGTTIPAKEICEITHDHGALFMLDAAQSVPHQNIDVKELDVDMLTFSVHKMLGPTGVGVLYGKEDILEELKPLTVGGGNTKESTYDSFELHPSPRKFESGLQNYASFIAVKDAVDYIQKIGLENIEKHERELNSFLTENLKEEIQIIGPKDPTRRSGILNIDTTDHDSDRLVKELDKNNIIVRSGRHCCYSYYNEHGIEDSVRVSTYIYNTREEIEKFTDLINQLL